MVDGGDAVALTIISHIHCTYTIMTHVHAYVYNCCFQNTSILVGCDIHHVTVSSAVA